MDFIQSSNKQVDKFGAGKHGFSAGNPAGGVLATYLSNLWCDGVQQEIINAIEAAGLAASGGDLTQLTQAIRKLPAGRLLNIQFITSSGTYTPTPGTASIVVTAVGGGGGGGGAQATAAGQCAAGAGGAAGGWCKKRITAGFAGATMTIGANGNGGGTTAGSAGGSTSFGAFCTANGGQGGSLGVAAANSPVTMNGVASGGVATGGDVNGVGGMGHPAFYAPNPISGKGGMSILGEGAGLVSTSTTAPGVNAASRGGGGSGSANAASQGTFATAGNGASGIIIIEEYS